MTESRIARDAVGAVFTAAQALPNTVSDRRPVMGIEATITLVGATQQLLDDCFALAHRCDELWSRFRADSELTKLNWAGGTETKVDPLTLELMVHMKEGFDLTRGDFDPTLLPAVVATGYDRSLVYPERVTTLPPDAQCPGDLAGIILTDMTVQLPAGTTLDSGGIGKGLAADLVVAHAREQGAWGALAEFAGDIAVWGVAPDGPAWRLGVENPFEPSEHLAVVRLAAGGVVTSSQRKRRFGTGAAQTHHLIDPRTHESITTDVQTVTVVAATAARAEVLSKPGFLRDPADYLEWLPSTGSAALLVMADGVTRTSANWGVYL